MVEIATSLAPSKYCFLVGTGSSWYPVQLETLTRPRDASMLLTESIVSPSLLDSPQNSFRLQSYTPVYSVLTFLYHVCRETVGSSSPEV